MTFVKVCGIRELETALLAVEAGADAVGFVFAPARRRIAPDAARRIIARLPRRVLTVGVFVDEDPGRVRAIARHCRLGALQFHGREPPQYCLGFELPVIKALRVGAPPNTENELARADRYPVWALLVDTFVPGQAGGTGRSFDWSLLSGQTFHRPLILAGGLDAGNVERAVRVVRPFGVDVSSGVETAGRKDPVKIRNFVYCAKEAG